MTHPTHLRTARSRSPNCEKSGRRRFGESSFARRNIVAHNRPQSRPARRAPHKNSDENRESQAAEAETAAGLCEHPAGTLLSIEREFTDAGVAERIRVIPKNEDGQHAKIWSVVEDDD